MKSERWQTPRSWRGRQWLCAIALLCGVALAAAIGLWAGEPILRFASNPEALRAWVNESGALSRLAYAGMVTLQIVFAFIPGEPLELAGGYAFGALEGTALCLFASSVASALVILAVRRWGVRLAALFFRREKLSELRFLKRAPRRTLLFFLLFMLPGSPKDLLCYFAGLTDIRLRALLPACALGRIPSIVSSTLAGGALSERSYVPALVTLGLTALLALIGLLIYRRATTCGNK